MSKLMAPLWLDYRRPPPSRQLPGIALLLASLVLTAWLLGSALDISTETALVERQVAKLRQAAERRRLFATTDPSTASIAGAAARPAESPSAGRWEALLTSLENAGDETVTLLSLTPGTREIVITGEAKGVASALDYAQRLQGSSVLTKAHVAKYEIQREHPRQPVSFTLLAEWRGGSR